VQDFILEMKGITKSFPGVQALDSVNLNVERGTIHALVGENGAGKSTLMKVLDGVYQADAGSIWLNGREARIRDPIDARAQGIGLIFQEFNLINQLSVAENIYMGRLEKRGLAVDWRRINREAQALIDGFGFGFRVTDRVEDLPTAQKQLVEIAKVLSYGVKLVVMDEPTSSLTGEETKKLFGIIRGLKAQGITFIYISHKLDEIFSLCDRVTVLRDGKVIETRETGAFTHKEIIERMVGRGIDMEYPKKDCPIGETILKVERVTRNGIIRDISFELRSGEILGIAGLVASGRTELAEALFGAARYDGGAIEVKGKKVAIHSTHEGKRQGIGLLTEDRKETGLVLSYDLTRNITVTNLSRVKSGPFLSPRKEQAMAAEYAKELGVKTPSMKQIAMNLSGGNQQKMVFAKWVFSEADVLILDEPTRGIDVGAKYEIYLLMNRLAAEGKAIIMISSELPEVLGMSDRVIVLSGGEMAGELDRAEATPEAVMRLALVN